MIRGLGLAMKIELYSKIVDEMKYLYTSRLKSHEVFCKPLFIFGNQKSGTSAVAGLLSIATQMDCTMDMRPRWYNYRDFDRFRDGEISAQEFVLRHSYEFSKPIIKEPNFSLVSRELLEYFSCSRSVYVIRHPLNNIKSILDRLTLDAHAKEKDLQELYRYSK